MPAEKEEQPITPSGMWPKYVEPGTDGDGGGDQRGPAGGDEAGIGERGDAGGTLPGHAGRAARHAAADARLTGSTRKSLKRGESKWRKNQSRTRKWTAS